MAGICIYLLQLYDDIVAETKKEEKEKNVEKRSWKLTVSYEPLDNVYHILDLDHVELRIDFMSYF